MVEQGGQFYFPASRDPLMNAIGEAAHRLHMRVRVDDRANAYMMLEVGVSFWSWGEDIPLQVVETAPGQSWVNIVSSSKFALIDWGKNKRNLDRLMDEVGQVLAEQGWPQAASPPPPAAQVPTAPGRFCGSCGAAMSEGARFCPVCGGPAQP